MTAFDQLLTLVEEQPLSRSLPAALRVADAIGDKALTSWIRLELMGYLDGTPGMTDDVFVPEYRTVVGQWRDDFGRVLAIDDPDLSFVNVLPLRGGIAELEGIAGGDRLVGMRAANFSKIIRESLEVNVTIFQFPARSVSQVLTNVKVQLIDRLSMRRSEIGALPVIESTDAPEILQFKPGLYGISVDLKVLWRRLFRRRPGAAEIA